MASLTLNTWQPPLERNKQIQNVKGPHTPLLGKKPGRSPGIFVTWPYYQKGRGKTLDLVKPITL